MKRGKIFQKGKKKQSKRWSKVNTEPLEDILFKKREKKIGNFPLKRTVY